jgi:hypothetical protein
MPVILTIQEAEIRRITVQSRPGQIVCETLSQKYPNTQKRAGRVAQVVEHLPSKYEVMSSSPTTIIISKTKPKTSYKLQRSSSFFVGYNGEKNLILNAAFQTIHMVKYELVTK